MNAVDTTRAFERWLARQTPVVRPDLMSKHARMDESPFVFLRATFYLWLTRWRDACADLLDAPRVLAVGDLHVENFGTWRDAEGRLIWGVNDVDEACQLPYAQDLVRLATSALLAIRHGHFAITRRDACAAIHEGYTASLQRGGEPMVLAERRRWLRDIAINDLRDPAAFWEKLTAQRLARGEVPRQLLRAMLPDTSAPYRVVQRVAGVGSLGRQRFVALADWRGGLIAREAKAFVPSALAWIDGGRSRAQRCETILARAVRVPDPFFAVHDRWIVRRLAPDCSRIELTELPRRRDERKLLRAMGWETANLHLGSPNARIISADLARRPARWLERAATRMRNLVIEDWRVWQRR